MPKFNMGDCPDMEDVKVNNNYSFSAVKIDDLGSTEQTIVTVVVDKSSSLHGYDRDLESMVQEAIKSCQKSPRADSLMARVVTFSSKEEELHGFKQLNNIDTDDYNNSINTGGCTTLFDTTHNAIIATKDYGKMLVDQDFSANAIIFVITDGCDYGSSLSAREVKKVISETRKAEYLDSIAVVLIGMTGESGTKDRLMSFKDEAELDEYIDMGEVSSAKLAKLAGYVSKSISSTSQALGTGGPSQSLTF
jgi:hypothetical protein